MIIAKSAAAKINLLLDIGQTFDNGYHSIYTIMQSVGIYDDITVNTRAEQGIALSCNDANAPLDSRNTAYKAAAKFYDYIGEKPSLSIDIFKRIPSQAGLGGASADAAAVLIALNEAHALPLSIEELCKLGKKVGADVPFCIVGGTQLCQNIGEILSCLPSFEGFDIVVIKPFSNAPTAQGYALIDACPDLRHPNRELCLSYFVEGDYDRFFAKSSNVFEQVIMVPERVDIKAIMRRHGSLFSFMSGSGSAVCGIFNDSSKARLCAQELSPFGSEVFVTEAVKNGVIAQV